MRWVLLLVSLGGCATLVPPPAEPGSELRSVAGSADALPPQLAAHQVDPDRPRAVCDGKGAAVSEWPDAIVRVAESVR